MPEPNCVSYTVCDFQGYTQRGIVNSVYRPGAKIIDLEQGRRSVLVPLVLEGSRFGISFGLAATVHLLLAECKEINSIS